MSAAGRVITFELRKYVGQRWLVDSVFDVKEFAIEEGKALIEHFSSVLAVRVMAVVEVNRQFREWTVFKLARGEDIQTVPSKRVESSAARSSASKDATPIRRLIPVAPKPVVRHYVQIATGLIIVIAAAAAGITLVRMM